jgi:tetratricopeptide (TPR) repeat protein
MFVGDGRQAIVAALNLAAAAKIREDDLATAESLLTRADVLLREARGKAGSMDPPGVHETNGMQRLQAVTLNNTACVHRRAGRLDQAMCCLHEALSADAVLRKRSREQRRSEGGGGAEGKIGANASALLLNLSTVLAVLGRWGEARERAKEAVECVWSFETHWQSPHEKMYVAVAGYHNLALAQRALGEHELAALSISLSLSASKHFFGDRGSLSKLVSPLLGHFLSDNAR